MFVNSLFSWKSLFFYLDSEWPVQSCADKVQCFINTRLYRSSFSTVQFYADEINHQHTMWKHMVQPDKTTHDSIIRRVRFACWITKAKSTHWEYVFCQLSVGVPYRLLRRSWMEEGPFIDYKIIAFFLKRAVTWSLQNMHIAVLFVYRSLWQ